MSDAVVGDSAALPLPPRSKSAREVIYRHTFLVRLTHWINVLAISLLLMSGLQIFNAHPRLYFGQFGADADRPWFELAAKGSDDKPQGVLRIGGLEVNTDGVLGVSKNAAGNPDVRGFPRWATLPNDRDLGTGRRWHFFLAWTLVINGLVYMAWGFVSGHFRKDLAPTRNDIRPRNIWRNIIDHAKLKHATGEEAKRYNILQKFAYLAMIVVVIPGVILTGMTMSPGIDAAWPWLLDLFGGRPTARSIHFICANLIVLFVIVHVVEVFLVGAVNEMRSMITGRYVVPPEHGLKEHA